MLEFEAPAKINLSLEVTGKRTDGFHEIVSVMQTVTLHDTLHMGPSDRDVFTCTESTLTAPENLVVRARDLLRSEIDIQSHCAIHLQKRIPIAAGLGGGSSDAATALRGLSQLWQSDGRTQRLKRIAERLGSDVPFFLDGGTCLVQGRGERVTALPANSGNWYLLVNPRIQVSTARVFAALEPSQWSDGSTTHALASAIARGEPAYPGMNGLQSTLFALYPPVERCYNDVESVAGGRALISGSGPTVIGWFDSAAAALKAEIYCVRRGYWTMTVRNKDQEEMEWRKVEGG